MFEVITTYTVENEIDIMGLRAELSYMIRSKNGDDSHLVRSLLQGEKTYITLVFLNVNANGEYLQEYADGYMVNTNGILVFDHLEWNSVGTNRYWLYDAINLMGGDQGKYYVPIHEMERSDDVLQDYDIIVSYDRERRDIITKIQGLWNGMWMKGIGLFYNNGWPLVQGEHEDWFQVKEHLPRVMGDFYQFYSNRLRNKVDLTFRIPYNFSIIHEICKYLPEHTLTINGGFLTVHDNLDKYEDIVNVNNVIENAIGVKYKTADYWGDNIQHIKPWSEDFNIQSIRINGFLCHLARIPNVISVEQGRKMIAYMLQDNIKVK